ncbi:hypothetical protein BLNAU_9866 [Blattamonas nauphoetae]|uniref:Uncharacterized protein n=1 Tax=Blattamonas nauphoetae TaxID=2049346 RepID=A0ABQ9XUI4_9EUKA|nr:hypothetical protein BLNAU_9866 [Blattamonas nauphoetae]
MMEILEHLILDCSSNIHLNLVKADLIPHLITHLNPLSLSFTDSQEIHSHLTSIISSSIWLATQYGLRNLQIKDWNEQQTIHDTVFHQVLIPSEPYLRHLCVNFRAMAERGQSSHFMQILGLSYPHEHCSRLPHIHPVNHRFFWPMLILWMNVDADEQKEVVGGMNACAKTSAASKESAVLVELRAAELAISQLTILKQALNPVVFLEADKSAGDADGDRRHDVPRALLGTLSFVVLNVDLHRSFPQYPSDLSTVHEISTHVWNVVGSGRQTICAGADVIA